MHRLLWAVIFFIGAPALLAISAAAYSVFTPSRQVTPQVLGASTQEEQDPSAILSEISASVTTADARELIIEQYLQRYNSPLIGFGKELVEVSDKYQLDFRLLVAIGQQESNLCKRIPENSFNCWGFGIYGDKVTRFDNYPQAFDTVARTLKKNYIDKGLDTPEEIMRKYTPPSVLIGGPWAKGVNQFLGDME